MWAINTWRGKFEHYVLNPVPHFGSLGGAVVEPDIMQMKNGLIALSFGVRIPERLCWEDCTVPENGIYLAFSEDGGETWGHVVQLLSGEMTTHYTAIGEVRENTLLYLYDVGAWHKGGRSGRGCFVDVRYTE